MVLDGRSIIDKKLVIFSEDYVNTDDQIQPNGVDLRINKLYNVFGKVSIPRDGRAKADMNITELSPKEGWFDLKPNHGLYWVDFLESANIADGYCAHLITRSSLVRSGIDVMSGLWDTGWNGVLGCSLRVQAPLQIEWGAKLCQIVVAESRFNGHRYDGNFQGTTSQTAIAQ